MAMARMPVALGNATGSDDCTATKAEVLKGYTAITRDSDDEPIQGTLELTGNATDAYVYSGKTYYNTDAKTRRTGSMTVSSVVSFSAASVLGGKVNFTWRNPSKGPYGGVIIRAKEGSYPTSVTDGIQAYKGTGSTFALNGTSTYLWTAAKTGVTYYFRIWMYCATSVGTLYSNYMQTTLFVPPVGQQIFTSSGTFTVPANVTKVQVFCVGGGSSGYCARYIKYSDEDSASTSASGGGGGYTKTGTFSVTPGQQILVTIGAGGRSSFKQQDRNAGGATSFGDLLTAQGAPRAAQPYYGGPGGSGGGGRGTSPGSGGSDGSDGIGGNVPGTGQGSTTRAFGSSSGTLYSGGGGGAYYNNYGDSEIGYGGAGGGANGKGDYSSSSGPAVYGNSAAANTGGGGGAFATSEYGDSYSGAGGSGICIVKWGHI